MERHNHTLFRLNVKSVVCVMLWFVCVCVCRGEEKTLNTESRLSDRPTHSHAFHWVSHWCSARTNLSTDWLLQTDAEGDTQSLINWPSRYTETGCVSPQTLLAVQKQCFLNLLAETELPLTQSWTDWGGGGGC